jgi:hypothetical protein
VYVVRIVLAPSSGSLYLISDLLTAVAVGLSVSTLLLLLAATTIDRRALAVLAALGLAVVALQGSSMLGWMWPIAAVVTTGLAVGVLAAPGGRRLTGGLPLALLSTGWLIGSALAMATPYLFVGPIDDYGYAILPGLVGMGIGAGAATLALGLIAARGGLRARFSHGDLALTGSP